MGPWGDGAVGSCNRHAYMDIQRRPLSQEAPTMPAPPAYPWICLRMTDLHVLQG